MSIYHYDQIYSYKNILQEVKDLILPTITKMVNYEDAKDLGLRKEDLANIYYTHIMALAYNDEDINAALNDLMPSRNSIMYPGSEDEDAANMMINLTIICENFERQIRAFRVFNHLTKELKPHQEVIWHVEMQLSMFN